MKKQKKGFTLIEILLVIAIIGILAGAVFAMIGNSDKTKLTSAQSTAKSIMTYAQECLFNNLPLTEPENLKGTDTDDIICTGSITTWPELSVDECYYDGISGGIYAVDCGEIGRIDCSAQSGNCKVTAGAPATPTP